MLVAPVATKIDVSVVLPAYNEVGNVKAVIDDAKAVLRGIPGVHEIVVVDDGSTDGTGAIADQLAAADPTIRVIRHQTNRGFSGAMLTCFASARGEWIFLAPCDGQVRMEVLYRFLRETNEAAIVVGRRAHRAEGFGRRALSWAFHRIARALLPVPLREFSSCFLFRRDAVQGPWRSRPDAATILPEVLYRASRRGLLMRTVEVEHFPRMSGQAKGAGLRVVVLSLLELFRLALLLRFGRGS